MDADRLRRLAIDGDPDALLELWALNARAPRPMSRARCGDYTARCATGRPTLAELARRAGVDLLDVEARLARAIRRMPLRREVRAVLDVAIEASQAFGTRPADQLWRILAQPALRNWPSGSGYDEPDGWAMSMEPCSPPRPRGCGVRLMVDALLVLPLQETCDTDDLVLGADAVLSDRCVEVDPDVGLVVASAHRAAVGLTAAVATARADIDGMRDVLLAALARLDPAQDE